MKEEEEEEEEEELACIITRPPFHDHGLKRLNFQHPRHLII
jgi:hypothetical protein